MASINEDNLREEESQGGFEPGQPEDDSFMLESQEKYPGELPDFDSDDEPAIIEDIEDIPPPDTTGSAEVPDEPASADEDVDTEDIPDEDINIKDVDMAEQIDPPAEGGTVWDSFDDEEQTVAEKPAAVADAEGIVPKQEEFIAGSEKDDPTEAAADDTMEPAEAETSDDPEQEPAEVAPAPAEPADLEADTAEAEIPDGIEDLILPAETPEELIESNDDDASGQDAEGVLDDDFKKALAGDIEKSKSRKEEAVAEQPAEDSSEEKTEEMKPEDFTPVDDHEEAQLIDINEIEADKPSNYDLQEESKPKADEMKIADNAVGPEAMPAEGRMKLKKKKKRKPLPFKRIAIIALITIFGTAVGFLGYNYVYNGGEGDIAHVDSLAGSESVSASHTDEQAANDADKQITKKADAELQKPGATDTAVAAAEDTKKKAEEVAAIEKTKAEQAYKPKPVKKYIAKAPRKKSKAPVQKKAKRKIADSKPINENDIAELPAEIKPEKPPQKKKASTKLPELPLPKSDKGLFTIQIYSSPSREDAEEWLNKLRNKKIRDSFISKHEIRNEIWYRVRFGKFETKQDARTTALRYGFAQTWIDRVR